MKATILKTKLATVATLFSSAALTSPASAHEGHGNTVHHALMHLLQEPDPLLLLGAAGVVVFAAWRYFKGKNK